MNSQQRTQSQQPSLKQYYGKWPSTWNCKLGNRLFEEGGPIEIMDR